jgi:inosine-uridine nucleoside N-ribohydrolase
LEIILISLTFGNVELPAVLQNALALFNVLDLEFEYRQSKGLPLGFEALRNAAEPPIIALGAEGPLEAELVIASYYHGKDGLGGVHTTHPQFSPKKTWADAIAADPEKVSSSLFRASSVPAHREILRVLKENDPETITIVAVGPLTNLALAAKEDPETFLRVQEVVSMGGSLTYGGNITPFAEFNVYADAVAAGKIYALTSPRPATTLPGRSDTYPDGLKKQLPLTLFPLDITTQHLLLKSTYTAKVASGANKDSPLTEWIVAFVGRTMDKAESYMFDGMGGHVPADKLGIQMHDPLCICK